MPPQTHQPQTRNPDHAQAGVDPQAAGVRRFGRPFEVRSSILDVGFFCLDYSPRRTQKPTGSFLRREAG
jgi:hypothetical protein